MSFLQNVRTLALTTLLLPAALFAATITGTVTNRTTGKPAAGDDVVLLNVAGMQEIQRVKTDARGNFSLDIPADGFHLVRVTHDKANYFAPVQPGTNSLAVDVYTAAESVRGVTLDADVMRIQTEPGGSGLRVIEHFFEKNESTPPETLFSDHAFVVYLPAGATIEGAAAKSPGGLAVQVAVQPGKEPNQYNISFPIRPGESEFQVTYRLAYSGSLAFQPRPAMPTDNLVVMLPKSMSFKAGAGTAYSPVTEDVGAQTFVARNVQPSQPLGFTIGGSGELPRDSAPGAGAGATAAGGPGSAPGAEAGAGPAQNASTDPNQNTLPGKGIDNPLDNSAQRESWVSKYKWWLIAGIGFLFAAAAGFMLNGGGAPRPRSRSGSFDPNPGTSPAGALQVLRDELFAVETERLEGKLSERDYLDLKAAYDVVLRRALARSSQSATLVQTVPE